MDVPVSSYSLKKGVYIDIYFLLISNTTSFTVSKTEIGLCALSYPYT